MTGWPELVCPACGAPLEEGRAELRCPACPRGYPVVAGIPDLRLRPDAYLTLEEDRAKARALAALPEEDFAGLLRAYWARTPEVPASLARRYQAAALDGRRRAEALLDALGLDVAGRRVLDVGTGTGGLLEAAARRGGIPAGVDIALRWLVVARRRLDEAGVQALLVAADGAALPFPPGAFELVTCIETLEHSSNPAGLLGSSVAAARRGGRVVVVAANRLSLAPDPVVRLLGVGWMPRRLAEAYVAHRRRTRYRHYRPPTAWRLRRLADGLPARVAAGPLPPPAPGAGAARLALQRAYEALRRSPLAGPAAVVAPFLELTVAGAGRALAAGRARPPHGARA
jgi:ubiquinone/menaquinone biosynthesis C-methylase UbiE/uncharacterized protein YbaR (Trm112 family)